MEELFAVIGVFTLPLSVGFGVAWWIKRAELRMRKEPPVYSPTADRFNRLEQAVDSIALEVERISEGQRFTTKLLSERQLPDAREAHSPARVITPH